MRKIGHTSFMLYRYARSDRFSRELRCNAPNWVSVERYHKEPHIVSGWVSRLGIELIHCHVESLPAVVRGIHGNDVPIVANFGSSAPLSLRLRRAISKGRVAAIVSVSRTGQRCLRHQLPAFKGQIVHIAQSTELICSSDEDLRIDRLIGGIPYVLVLASFGTYKGIHTFVDAMAIAKRKVGFLKGIIVGRIRGTQISAVRRLVSSRASLPGSGVTVGACTFVGPSYFPGSWVRRASVIVCSSCEYEGIPGALREGMLAGVPVVTTDVGHVRELVSDRWNGLIVPKENPHRLSDAIVHSYMHPHDIDVQVHRARTFVKSHFGLASRIKRHIELYSTVLATRTSG